jgi:hypothetical protein
MREKLDGVGIACGEFVQYHEEFNRLANDPGMELLGFSNGSLSGDYTNSGYGWLVAVKEHEGSKMGILLAGGGGAAITSHAANVLYLYSILPEWKLWDWRQVCRTPEIGLVR